MSPIHHLTKSEELLNCAALLRDNFQSRSDNYNIGYLTGYCILMHLAVEHLLKSFLDEEEVQLALEEKKGHDLEWLYRDLVSKGRTQETPAALAVMEEINKYGYPVDGSERYPKTGSKFYYLQSEFIAEVQKLQVESGNRLQTLRGLRR